jgi:hypothetical protein
MQRQIASQLMIYELIHHTNGGQNTLGYFPMRTAFKMLRVMSAVHGAENLSLVLAPESMPYINR